MLTEQYDFDRIVRESVLKGLLCNLPCEVFLPQHVAGDRRIPGRGHLGWWVHWLGLHCPHIVVADVVVHHCGEGWREGQASRGKERMITTQAYREDHLNIGIKGQLPRLLFLRDNLQLIHIGKIPLHSNRSGFV